MYSMYRYVQRWPDNAGSHGWDKSTAQQAYALWRHSTKEEGRCAMLPVTIRNFFHVLMFSSGIRE